MARRYAPALTQQAFKLARPKGNYQTYLRYLQAHRHGWDPQRPQVTQRVGPPKRGALPSASTSVRTTATTVPLAPGMATSRAGPRAVARGRMRSIPATACVRSVAASAGSPRSSAVRPRPYSARQAYSLSGIDRETSWKANPVSAAGEAVP